MIREFTTYRENHQTKYVYTDDVDELLKWFPEIDRKLFDHISTISEVTLRITNPLYNVVFTYIRGS